MLIFDCLHAVKGKLLKQKWCYNTSLVFMFLGDWNSMACFVTGRGQPQFTATNCRRGCHSSQTSNESLRNCRRSNIKVNKDFFANFDAWFKLLKVWNILCNGVSILVTSQAILMHKRLTDRFSGFTHVQPYFIIFHIYCV